LIDAGANEFRFKADGISGCYICVLKSDSGIKNQKIIIVKR